VHLRYANTKRNEFTTYTGHGTEVLSSLGPGGTVNNPQLGISINFCMVEGEFVIVTVGPDADSAARACPNYGITTARPDWAHRCKFVEKEKYG